MSFLAPYVSSMRLGQGFNSYTQETCIEDAVLIHPAPRPVQENPPASKESLKTTYPTNGNAPSLDTIATAATPSGSTKNGATDPSSVSATSNDRAATLPAPNGTVINYPTANRTEMNIASAEQTDIDKALGNRPTEVAGPSAVKPIQETPPHSNPCQIVTYSSRAVDNISDVVDALNISSSASIKYGTISGSGSASFVNENKVNQAQLNYIITVKVTNATSPIPDVMKFNPMKGIDNSKFTAIYGDCFISGFLEGGEFASIISIKVNSKSKIAGVKAAAEAQLAIAAVPGLTAGAKGSIDKNKSDAFADSEISISVNWSGGGKLKEDDQVWDLPTVLDVANKFPEYVSKVAQKTSAVLTKYSSLRTFIEEDAKNGKDNKFKILDYDLCSLYTQDLFSAYTTYKGIWTKLSEMLKNPDDYQELEKTPDVPEPIQLTPKRLNDARLLARWAMTAIVDETKKLIVEPQYANFDEHGMPRPLPYKIPGELEARLPIRAEGGGESIKELTDPEQGSTGRTPLTPAEIAAVGKWARRDDLHLSPLAGDLPPPRSSWLERGENKLFCTLDLFSDPVKLDALAKVRLHAHQHRHFDILADFHHYSKDSEGYLSALGFSTMTDLKTQPGPDGTHRHINDKVTTNERFWSHLGDCTQQNVAKVILEYFPNSGRIVGVSLLDAGDNEVTSWKQYGQAKAGLPTGLKVEVQKPPRGEWSLIGFWGHMDAIVITRLGAIWKKA